MNIQSYIDRKRIAGKREHEGRQTDWAGWTGDDYIVAIAGELLDACAYAQRAFECAAEWETKDEDYKIFCVSKALFRGALEMLKGLQESDLEAACQEAEQEANETLPEKVRRLAHCPSGDGGKQFMDACKACSELFTEEERNALVEEAENE